MSVKKGSETTYETKKRSFRNKVTRICKHEIEYVRMIPDHLAIDGVFYCALTSACITNDAWKKTNRFA